MKHQDWIRLTLFIYCDLNAVPFSRIKILSIYLSSRSAGSLLMYIVYLEVHHEVLVSCRTCSPLWTHIGICSGGSSASILSGCPQNCTVSVFYPIFNVIWCQRLLIHHWLGCLLFDFHQWLHILHQVFGLWLWQYWSIFYWHCYLN